VRAALATFARDAGIAGTALGVVLAAVVFVIWRRRRREGG
jgi:LPXTG-motif cell wall-anchored protein